jgi:hypothetical protein
MSECTARKDERAGVLPSQLKQPQIYQATRWWLGGFAIWYDAGMLSAVTGSWGLTGNRRWTRPNAWFLDSLDTKVVDIARLAWIQHAFVL